MRPIDLSAATWRRSSYSNTNGGECVEVADGYTDLVPVRDSKAPTKPALTVSTASWLPFIQALKAEVL